MNVPSVVNTIRVVVAVVRAGIDAVRVAVDELRDLLIVERRQRARLRGGTAVVAETAGGETDRDGGRDCRRASEYECSCVASP